VRHRNPQWLQTLKRLPNKFSTTKDRLEYGIPVITALDDDSVVRKVRELDQWPLFQSRSDFLIPFMEMSFPASPSNSLRGIGLTEGLG
jgi:hypothetical protein